MWEFIFVVHLVSFILFSYSISVNCYSLYGYWKCSDLCTRCMTLAVIWFDHHNERWAIMYISIHTHICYTKSLKSKSNIHANIKTPFAENEEKQRKKIRLTADGWRWCGCVCACVCVYEYLIRKEERESYDLFSWYNVVCTTLPGFFIKI